MINTKLNINIADACWMNELPEVETLSQEIFDKVINRLNIDWLKDKNSVEVNLALSNDEEIRQLNAEFRNMDKATNVLSFANIDDEEFEAYLERNNDIELGDIIVALQTMLVQAESQGLSLRDHYCHILVHGFLHLLGYDHIEKEEAAEMEAEEIRLLQTFGIANPYEENE